MASSNYILAQSIDRAEPSLPVEPCRLLVRAVETLFPSSPCRNVSCQVRRGGRCVLRPASSVRHEIAPPRAAAHRHGRADSARWPRRRAHAINAHPASDCGVGKDAPVEEHSLSKPCCSRMCTRLLPAELSHLKNPRSRSAIAIANADGPNPIDWHGLAWQLAWQPAWHAHDCSSRCACLARLSALRCSQLAPSSGFRTRRAELLNSVSFPPGGTGWERVH